MVDGECTQTLVHPAISVWTVSAMPNGDIVSGTSDGVVRVFSASEDRWATAEELKQYDNEVAGQALPSYVLNSCWIYSNPLWSCRKFNSSIVKFTPILIFIVLPQLWQTSSW